MTETRRPHIVCPRTACQPRVPYHHSGLGHWSRPRTGPPARIGSMILDSRRERGADLDAGEAGNALTLHRERRLQRARGRGTREGLVTRIGRWRRARLHCSRRIATSSAPHSAPCTPCRPVPTPTPVLAGGSRARLENLHMADCLASVPLCRLQEAGHLTSPSRWTTLPEEDFRQ